MEGKLIVFEGLDKSGKSTQCKKLYNYMLNNNIKCILMTFPNRSTDIGNIIDKYLKKEINLPDESIHLLFSANRWEFNNILKKHIDEGVHVILDRYTFSGIAFSAAKGLDINWCKECDKGLKKADIVFYLETNFKNLTREMFGNERYETYTFQHKVKYMYDYLINNYSLDSQIEIIDASLSINDVFKNIKNKLTFL
ncbi:Thymidylate kinase [Eptesipox virus]|uniref:Thymidylate kinase n=1 Tax=Eptesipox virus TaxID=1329402 RepID=A0A220T6K7_9POXV|nr:thymidylate kinase [Eptesipox virus]ASK51348.1 Thymidylate kinase [Eptesipox virus]WAH71106.1 thymidylate kinase [Eptesipox virus]